MMFQTLEGLTAEEQEQLEAEQRAASGRNARKDRRRLLGTNTRRGALNPGCTPKKILDLMQPGVGYRAAALLTPTGAVYSTLQGLIARKFIQRTGERGQYLFTKVAPGGALNALGPEPA